MPVLHRVRLLPNDTTVFAAAGTTLYDAVRDAAGMPDAVCGGNGRCGKCALELLENGRRTRVLACRTVIDRDMTVFLPEPQKQRILSGGITRAAFPLTPADGYAAAFDIGTTTLVCSLLERGTGQELITLGALNPQASFGADVIARIKTALEIGVPPLTRAVLGGMNRLLGDAAAQAGISLGEITLCSIAGNSCMQHLLLGLPVRPLASAPYAPVSTEAVVTSAGSLGLALPPETSVRIQPLIGGFVGADTVGCLLATDFANGADDALLLDIGTNGELVLRHGGRLVACSAAAGPALEGGNISCGMRGSTGAIDHAAIADGKLRY